jgi:Icc protein
MPGERDQYTIAQFSDIHCGDARFDSDLLKATLDGVNQLEPDLVVVAGDLTADGYREQFLEAKKFLDQLECDHVVVMAGNHDCRNVGYLHFEELFGGRRSKTLTLGFGICCGARDDQVQKNLRVLALDSNKPDLNDGEIGRDHYGWIDDQFPEVNDYKIFVLHHHLVGIPGTGRERNVVWDAGDVLERLRAVKVDLVLCGHRHVPYTWPVADMLIISSGTASTWRTRGFTQPSYNTIRIDNELVTVKTMVPDGELVRQESFKRTQEMDAI